MFRSGNYFRVGSYLPLATMFLIQDRFNSPGQDNDRYPVEDLKTCMLGCMEPIVLEKAGVRGEVLGQGDNQTLVIHTRPGQSKNATRPNPQYLEAFAKKCGLILKPEECWSSDVLYEYGKKLYFKGAQVSNVLKIFSRITDSTGELYPSIFARLACLSSSCLSAS